MSKIDEVLSEIGKVNNKVDTLNLKLYGEGEFEGDIPVIKEKLKAFDTVNIRSQINSWAIGLLFTSGGVALSLIGLQINSVLDAVKAYVGM